MAQTSCLVFCPLVANSVEEIVIQMHQAKADGADIIELRLDHLHNFNPNTHLQIILNQRLLPIIVTYRPKWEGGEYEGEEVTRLDTLRLALELGADYVDVELQVALTFIKSICEKKSRNSKIIVSSHNFQCTPSLKDLGELVTRIQDTGADVVKIATTATNITDVNRIFQVLSNPQEGLHAQSEMTAPVIALAMGMRGLISRILCPKFGGYVTFASIGIGKESASGQPTLTDLTKIYKIKNLSRDTKIFGIIGNPVGHSKGPILHNQAFREIGFDAIYVPFLVDDLSQFLTVYCTPDFAGFSVTIPHKEAALQCCDEVEPVAQSIGAVNTIVRRQSDGKLIGYNTDYMGAISAVVDGLKGRLGSGDWENTSPLSGRMFVVVGAGGAGKALAYGAKEKGARVAIANRNFERAKVLASLVGGEAIPLEKLDSFCPENGMILANTTSVGMHPNVNDTPISKVAETRFASHIIVLRQLVQVKDALQSMVIRNNWGVWKKKNTERANKTKDRLLADSWWECVEYLLKITEPIMSMLRYTDMDRPWLGEIYDGIGSMIEKIRQVIHEEEQDPQETFFKQVQQIINERWNKMTTPLHFLAYALTPK